MSKFNTPAVGTKTTNLAGGSAYSESPELELVSLLLTSFVQDKFYESAQAQVDRVQSLVKQVDPEFAAKAAVYARQEMGMRSISHVLAVALIPYLKGTDFGRDFYKAVVRRPDDMTEMFALFLSTREEKFIPMAMREGFKEAFDKFDNYRIAKYRGEGKKFSLVDLVNIVHPIPTEKNADALRHLVEGTLVSTDTWEAKLTEAGKSENVEESKSQAWGSLLSDGQLGYFAALRNIRNILEQAPDQIDALVSLLKDPEKIKTSLVLPFRFLTALEALRVGNVPIPTSVLDAIVEAVDISLENVPVMDGKTLVMLDESGSMTFSPYGGNRTPPARIGALFAAALVRANNADLVMFDLSARYINLPPAPILTQAVLMEREMHGGGTNLNAAFDLITGQHQKYDRIIILSDMQSWAHHRSGPAMVEKYTSAVGQRPIIYSFDLNGYGTLSFPEKQVFAIAGFSEKVFEVMKMLEEDRNALINRVKAVEL